jgi:type VI secretion system protein ImpE
VLINGGYYWMPFNQLSRIDVEAPSDVRDLVWLPAQLTLTNGGETAALIPTRYPGSETIDDDAIRLSRRTDWKNADEDTFIGSGQRILTTDSIETGVLELRELVLSA